MRRRVVLGIGVGVALLAGAIVLRAALDDGADDPLAGRGGSELVVESPSRALAPDEEPASFRIDYRVEIGARGEVVVGNDRLWVQRPFASRLEAYDGVAVDGRPGTVEISAFGRRSAEAGGVSSAVVLAVPPAPGLADTRLLRSLADAVADGRVERRERRIVLGRECDVYRSLAPLAVSDLVPGTEDELTDTCIDAAGLVLEEVVVSGGERVARRVAVDVRLEDHDDDRYVTGEPTLDTEDGGGFLAELVPGSRTPGTFWEPDGAPAGFELEGRYVAVPPQAQNFADPDRRALRRTFVSDVFVSGPDVVVFDQGSTLGNVDAFPGFDGVRIDVEGFDDVALSYGRGGPVLLADLGAGRFLRVRGTVDPSVLVSVLSGVRAVEGGDLELVDPPP